MFKKKILVFCLSIVCCYKIADAEKSWNYSTIIVVRKKVDQPTAKKACAEHQGRLPIIKNFRIYNLIKDTIGNPDGKSLCKTMKN